MLDLNLLRTFVAVADAGGFTRAGGHVHRAQSTVSQQVRRLEDGVGRPLFERDRPTSGVALTPDGELLLDYARRLLDLADEAFAAVTARDYRAIVRLGIPEDLGGRRLSDLLAAFARQRPLTRLDVRSAWSNQLTADLSAGDLDLALVKREAGRGGCIAATPERVVWASGAGLDVSASPLPLALFPRGCVYRSSATALLRARGRLWQVAFESQGLAGVQAAISSGLGVGLLPEPALETDHRVLSPEDGFPPLPPTELALVAAGSRPRAAAAEVIEFLVQHLQLIEE